MQLEIVWGFSSASLSELAEAAADDISLTFVEPPDCPIDPRTRRAMERIGRVTDFRSPVDADGILTFCDAQLVPTAERAEHAGLRSHTRETAMLLTRKNRQRAALTAAGLPQPDVRTVGSVSELRRTLAATDPPVVVKPAHGTGSRHAYALRSRAEMDAFARNAELPDDVFPFLVESRINGAGHPRYSWLEDFVSVETVSFGGIHQHFGVTARLPLRAPLRETGSVFPAMLPSGIDRSVRAETTRALDALGVTDGVSHTELKLTTRRPVVIEVNGRLGGAIDELQTTTGAYQPVRAALRLAAGHPPPPTAPPHGYAAVMWHHMDGSRPGNEAFDTIRSLDEVVRLQVPRDETARVSEGRLAAPITVVLRAGTEHDLGAAVAHCREALGAGGSSGSGRF
ncbi:ATP-grasp domain-containing protein [Jatrophihabitans lederbergiae]|uniref:ATP-grasp domain-containing protein n=1 Tax=Jatrophihabitans lederbergiae TaxID=3075547 RepID=A0ABU2JGN5_9ACTN|nr:hypothetical protein [Jatrophihabitans sp. DSM 44399]MDT0263916.1 hypothetical protein [Jatrophihabitans sp. DSM 44399]